MYSRYSIVYSWMMYIKPIFNCSRLIKLLKINAYFLATSRWCGLAVGAAIAIAGVDAAWRR